MKRFKSILVGVDLADGERLVSSNLKEPSREAVERAIWLAKASSAHLNFYYVLPTWAASQDASPAVPLDEGYDKRTVEDHALEVMVNLVDQARSQGVVAESRVGFGRSWIEIIRQVIRADHDLVIVGAKDPNGVMQFITGSTEIKLLRKCPCAVWVTQPRADLGIESILVAHDLSPVGDLAMELGCSMAQMHDSQLHVVHVAEYPEINRMFPARVSAESAASYRREAKGHIAAQLRRFDLPGKAHVHLEIGAPALAIWHCIEENNIDLVVMGTVARTGIPGLITGNTAERLLPLIPCSILAVKPAGFESPISLDSTTSSDS